MHRLAPALFAALALTACEYLEGETGSKSASCGDACKVAEDQLGLVGRTIHHLHEKTFKADGVAYTLVRVEYGDTEECDLFGDCWYSTYCGFVVDGQQLPLEVSWVTDEDALFDAIKAGAAAFILKDVGPDDLVTIIRRVVTGEYLINDKVFAKPSVASRVLKEFRELAVYGQEAAPIFAHVGPMPYPVLQSLFDPLLPPGLQWYWKGDFVRELTDEAYFNRCVLAASAHNMPIASWPWRFASVLSVASHSEADPEVFFHNPRPPVEFHARGMDVEVAWAGGAEARESRKSPAMTGAIGSTPAASTLRRTRTVTVPLPACSTRSASSSSSTTPR